MDSIHDNLKNKLLKDYYGGILKKKKLFSDNFSIEAIESLSLKMTECVYSP
jgi:hypothetical protein